jgi:hypothetical protein
VYQVSTLFGRIVTTSESEFPLKGSLLSWFSERNFRSNQNTAPAARITDLSRAQFLLDERGLFKEGAIDLEALSGTTNGDADSVVMDPACQLPKFI